MNDTFHRDEDPIPNTYIVSHTIHNSRRSSDRLRPLWVPNWFVIHRQNTDKMYKHTHKNRNK